MDNKIIIDDEEDSIIVNKSEDLLKIDKNNSNKSTSKELLQLNENNQDLFYNKQNCNDKNILINEKNNSFSNKNSGNKTTVVNNETSLKDKIKMALFGKINIKNNNKKSVLQCNSTTKSSKLINSNKQTQSSNNYNFKNSKSIINNKNKIIEKKIIEEKPSNINNSIEHNILNKKRSILNNKEDEYNEEEDSSFKSESQDNVSDSDYYSSSEEQENKEEILKPIKKTPSNKSEIKIKKLDKKNISLNKAKINNNAKIKNNTKNSNSIKPSLVTKSTLVQAFLKRWWYAINIEWYKDNTPIEVKLDRHNLLKVDVKDWKLSNNNNSQGKKKCVEFPSFPYVFLDCNDDIHDLRNMDNCPSYDNFIKKEKEELICLVIKALTNQIAELESQTQKYSEKDEEVLNDLKDELNKYKKIHNNSLLSNKIKED